MPRGRKVSCAGLSRFRWPAGDPAVAAVLAAGVLWGTSFLFGKWALAVIGPTEVTLWRFVIASCVLLAVPQARAVRLRRRDLPLFVLAGVLNVPATFLPQFAGLSRTNASIAALIIGTLPALVAVASWLLLADRLGRRGWLAVLASTAGVAVTAARPGAGNDWAGDALVLASMLAVVGWVLLGKRLMRDYPPLAATTWIITFGTAALVPIGLLGDGAPRLDLPPRVWGSLLALGVGCTAAAAILWNWGLRHLPAGAAGVFLTIEPLTGALLGIALLGDPPRVTTLVGGALILGAAITISGQRSRRARQVHSA